MRIWARIRQWAMQGPDRPFVTPKVFNHKQNIPKIGLALGGGFARGMAHLGVIQVFEENGIPIHALAGTSAGSIVAAGWAGGRSVAEMIATTQSLRFRDFGAWTLSRWGLASNERM